MSSAARLVLLYLAALLPATLAAATDAEGFQDTFDVPRENFVDTGRNTYFILEPGYQLVLQGKGADAGALLVITVLDEARRVQGYPTRVVEERETEDGELTEVSRNFFSIDSATGDAYYFGEEVDVYEDGEIVGHPGAWLHGRDGAHYGLFMPAEPFVGQKFYQEVAPGLALDRVEVLSLTTRVKVPAGTFTSCLKAEETTPLEPDALDHKFYAPGVGLLIDGGLRLVSHGQAPR